MSAGNRSGSHPSAQLPWRLALAVLMLVLAGLSGARADAQGPSMMMAEATGRAVILSAEQQDEARSRALEEALWLAALQGGARIDGFSAMGSDTALSEHFALRADARILDYTVLKEAVEGEHYSVSVRAAVGELEQASCNPQRRINMTVYPARLSMDSRAPASAGQAGQMMLDTLDSLLAEHPMLATVFADSEQFDPARLGQVNRDFDYQSLTGTRRHIPAGHLVVIPHLELNFDRRGTVLLAPEKLQGQLRLALYRGGSYQPLPEKLLDFEIGLGSRVFLHSLTVLSRPDRRALQAEMQTLLPDFVDQLAQEMTCQPQQGRMQLLDGQLRVSLPEHHGLKQNQLARVSGDHTLWTLLRVTEAGKTEVRLSPLDNARDLARLDGRIVEFMEMK